MIDSFPGRIGRGFLELNKECMRVCVSDILPGVVLLRHPPGHTCRQVDINVFTVHGKPVAERVPD